MDILSHLVSSSSRIHFVPWSIFCLRSIYTKFLCELILSLISKVFSSPSLALDFQAQIFHQVFNDCISLSCYPLKSSMLKPRTALEKAFASEV